MSHFCCNWFNSVGVGSTSNHLTCLHTVTGTQMMSPRIARLKGMVIVLLKCQQSKWGACIAGNINVCIYFNNKDNIVAPFTTLSIAI